MQTAEQMLKEVRQMPPQCVDAMEALLPPIQEGEVVVGPIKEPMKYIAAFMLSCGSRAKARRLRLCHLDDWHRTLEEARLRDLEEKLDQIATIFWNYLFAEEGLDPRLRGWITIRRSDQEWVTALPPPRDDSA